MAGASGHAFCGARSGPLQKSCHCKTGTTACKNIPPRIWPPRGPDLFPLPCCHARHDIVMIIFSLLLQTRGHFVLPATSRGSAIDQSLGRDRLHIVREQLGVRCRRQLTRTTVLAAWASSAASRSIISYLDHEVFKSSSLQRLDVRKRWMKLTFPEC